MLLWKQQIPSLFDEERTNKQTNEKDGENLFFKGLTKIFLLTTKSCLWPTDLLDFMKGNHMLYYYVMFLKVD